MKKVLIVEDEILARLGLRQLVDCNRWRRSTGNDPEQSTGYYSS